MRKHKDRRVSVIWYDASSSSTTWMPRKIAAGHQPYVCETVGWLLRSDKTVVVVAMAKHNDDYAQTFDIPRGMVRKIRTLR